jgi:Heme/copper-type cytochrome/quinol oxidases, subunit 2
VVGGALPRRGRGDIRPVAVSVDSQRRWEVRYPGVAGATANEIHIPVGEPVRVRLRTVDVLHSFWVPQLMPKTDLIAGKVRETWLRAERPGRYRGQCAEYCGLQHAHMAFQVVAQPRAEFDAWLARLAAPAPAPASDADAPRPAGVPAGDLRRLPHRPGHLRHRHCRAGPVHHRRPVESGRGGGAERRRTPGRLDRELPDGQAGQRDAATAGRRGGTARPDRIPGIAAVGVGRWRPAPPRATPGPARRRWRA